MPKENVLSFEEVDAHVKRTFTEQHQKAFSGTENAAGAAGLCGIYGVVRPILVLASQAFFIPKAWREAIKVLISTLDAMCPQHG